MQLSGEESELETLFFREKSRCSVQCAFTLLNRSAPRRKCLRSVEDSRHLRDLRVQPRRHIRAARNLRRTAHSFSRDDFANVVEFIERLDRSEVVDVEMQNFVAHGFEHRIVELKKRQLGSAGSTVRLSVFCRGR